MIDRLVQCSVFLFGVLVLVAPSGYSVSFVVLMLVGLGIAFGAAGGVRNGLLEREDLILAASITGFGLWLLIAVMIHGDGTRELDRPSRFVLFLPLLIALLRYPPNARTLMVGIAIGGVLVGLWGGWQRWMEDISRLAGHTNTIQHGNIALLIGAVCLSFFSFSPGSDGNRKRLLINALMLMGALGGLLASALSGARGGWVAIPFLALLFGAVWLAGRQIFQWRTVGAAAFGVMLVLVGAMSLPIGVDERIDRAVTEYQSFSEQPQANTSVGVRLVQWQAASFFIGERPFLGWGDSGFREKVAELAEAGEIQVALAGYGHPHNDYLNAWVKYGLPGLVTLLLMYAVPFVLYAAKLRGCGTDYFVRPAATAGMAVCLCYAVFSLTQTFFAHNSGVMVYCLLHALLWGLVRSEKSGTITPPPQPAQ